jgi:hypothetical protein
MTDQFLTVEEALRGWLNGETLQWRFPDDSLDERHDPKNNPWRSLPPLKDAVGVALDTADRQYRFMPKQRWAWVIVSKADGFPTTVFPTKPEADGYCARNSWAQAVRMVEQPE